jgi:hypothetical protein
MGVQALAQLEVVFDQQQGRGGSVWMRSIHICDYRMANTLGASHRRPAQNRVGEITQCAEVAVDAYSIRNEKAHRERWASCVLSYIPRRNHTPGCVIPNQAVSGENCMDKR